MRPFYVLSSSLLWCLWCPSVDGYVLPRDEAVTAPDCSSTCLATYIPRFCGSTSNTSCICTNTNLTAAVTLCAFQSCNTTEILQLEKYSAVSCGVKNDKSRLNMVLHVDYIIPFLTACFLGGRITGRLLLGVGLGSDDWTMVAAFATYMAGVGTSLGLVLNEFGEHTFWLSETQIVTALKFFYVTELFYILSNTLTKLSLLLFFLRIFPNKVFLRRVQIFSAFVILSGLALFLAMAFQCVPFHGYWTNWTLPTESPLRTKCINQYAALYVASGLSIFQNFVILILPIPTLWRLELSKGRRANVLVMFSVGSGVIIFSFLRLPSLARLKGSTDLSYDQAPIVIYSHLEQAFGIICACLPACRSLLEYFFPALRLNLSGAEEHASNSRHMNQNSSVAGGKSVLRRSRRNTSSRALVELTDRNEVDGGECGDKEVGMLEMLRGVKRGMSKSSVAISETAVGTDVDEERDRVVDDEKGSRARKSSGKGSKMMNTWESDGHGVIVMTMTVEQSNQSVENVRTARAHMHAREGSDCSIGKAS